MAGHVAAAPSCIKLHMPQNLLGKRGYMQPISGHRQAAQRKSPNVSCNSRWLPQRKMCKLSDPIYSNSRANPSFRLPPLKCTCLAPLADLDGIAASDWVPLGDEVLLMASVFLTYMAGVIPVQKSNISPRKNISEDIGSPSPSGSARKNDRQGDLHYAWDVVKGKLLDSLDAVKHGNTLGSRVLKSEKPRGKLPLSLYAIAEGPMLQLLWACFQELEKEVNNGSNTINMDDWMTSFPVIVIKPCQLACKVWLKREFHKEDSNSDKALASLMYGKLNQDSTILEKIRKLGKQDLYAEFLYFHKFGSHRKASCYDPSLFLSHGISILEDLVITLADGIASIYLELISVDGNLSDEMSGRELYICSLSSRALQKLRNEVALYQWVYQNLEAVASMYEDRFDLYTLQSQVIEKPGKDGTESHSWWKKLKLGKSETISSPLRYSIITHFSMPVKRIKELRALTGWRYYYSLFLELSDIGMPIIRAVLDKISSAISFFLVTLIGRSLGLIYTGIRQSLRWK